MTEGLFQGALALAFAPLVPVWALAALGLAAAALLVLSLRRRARGAFLRALVAASLLGALANPSLVEETRAPLGDVALVVRDVSPSMGIGDRAAKAEETARAIADLLAARPGLEVRVVEAGGTGKGAGDDGTLLFGALDRALADVPPERLAGTILITDGQVHDAPAEAALAARASNAFGAPVHVLLAGRRGERDRRLVVEEAPGFGMVDRPLSLVVRVEDAAPDGGRDGGGADKGAEDAAGRVARLVVRQDGGDPATFDVPVGERAAVPIRLSHGGPSVIELEAAAGPDEITLDNNRAVVTINGVRDRMRVLLISGEPHPGERAWRNLLKADPAVDLVHFTILRPPEKQDGTPVNELSLIAFPTRELFEEKLGEFDLVIFDRYRRRGILPMTYLANVARWVEGGGAVLVAASPNEGFGLDLNQTPLGGVLPVRTTGRDIAEPFRPTPTEAGRRHPVTAGLPGSGPADGAPSWGHWYRLVEADAADGDVLLQGAGARPLLVLGRRGEGRVAELLSDHAWLWQRGHDGGGPQAELFRRLAHWLLKEPDLEEEDLRASAIGFRLDIERRSLSADPVTLNVTGPGDFRREIAASPGTDGRTRATLEVPAPGLYRIGDGTRTAVAAVGPLNPREFRDVRTSAELLAPVARATGGGIFWLEDGLPQIRATRPGRATAGPGWLGLRANEAYSVSGIAERPLLPGIFVLFLALGGLVAAWRREGR